MKIANIKNYTFPISKINTNTTKKKFKQTSDLLDINFTALKKQNNSTKLQETFASDFMKNRAIKEVIENNDGTHNTEIEEIFLETYLDMLDMYEEDGEEITQDFKLNLQEATIATFKSLKRKDGSFNLQQNIPNLIITAFEAIENNVYDIDEIFDYCKYIDGSICEELVQLICEQKAYYPNISNQEMFYMFSQYFIDKKTGIIDTNTIPMLFSLFSLAEAKNLSQTDALYTLVINENNEFDEKRYEFAYNSIEQLQKIKEKEVSKKSQNEDQYTINAMMTFITGSIIESTTLINNGKFDLKQAQETLEYLVNNIKSIDVLYKNEGLQAINLRPQNQQFEQGSIYNSRLYKLFNFLYY